jgi:hypothetical protein
MRCRPDGTPLLLGAGLVWDEVASNGVVAAILDQNADAAGVYPDETVSEKS